MRLSLWEVRHIYNETKGLYNTAGYWIFEVTKDLTLSVQSRADHLQAE